MQPESAIEPQPPHAFPTMPARGRGDHEARGGDATALLKMHGHDVWIAHDAGFDAHLTKPAEPGLILSAVAPEESDDDVARRA